jgi:two-component system, LuxR family, response regulator FixJ
MPVATAPVTTPHTHHDPRVMGRPNPTLFVVDDVPTSRTSVANVASAAGVSCETFASAEEFLEGFDPSCLGCAVIDLHLAGINGLQLQQRLATIAGTLPVIFVSACASVREVVTAMQNGAITVLEKPCCAEELTSAIREALAIGREAHAARLKQEDLQKRFNQLSPRECQVLELIVAGEPNKTIARRLSVSQRTVDRVRADIFVKLGVESAVEAARTLADLAPQATLA